MFFNPEVSFPQLVIVKRSSGNFIVTASACFAGVTQHYTKLRRFWQFFNRGVVITC